MRVGGSVTEMEKGIVLTPRESTICSQKQTHKYKKSITLRTVPREQDSRYKHGQGRGASKAAQKRGLWVGPRRVSMELAKERGGGRSHSLSPVWSGTG